jgi:hypothetical protein
VLTDKGILFMSHEGIWLLSKGYELVYIGKDVEAYNSLTITNALNLVDRHQVWFMSLEGTTLCYDEFHGVWSVFTGQDTSCATLVGTAPYFVKQSNGYVLKESAGTFNDNGTTFSCRLTSGWMSLAGIQGFQRMYRFTVTGAASNNATLTLYRDWSGSSFETFTIPSTVASQWQVRPAIQKGEAMKFDLLWSNITGAVSVSAFGIEAGMKADTYKLAPTNRVQGS